MPLGGLIAGGVGVLGGVIGNAASSGDREAAQQAVKEATKRILGVETPNIEQQKLALQMLQQVGVYTPEMEGDILSGPSKMEDVTTSPEYQKAQEDALRTLQELGKTGLSAEDRATLNNVRRDTARAEQGREGAILQNLSARGMLGGGQELAAKLASSQAGAEQASQEGDRVAAMAQNRALQAIAQGGQLGGQLRSQQFGEKSDAARAADTIAQFNTANRIAAQARNIGSQNTAQQQNLATKQGIANQNVGLQNAQQQYNKELLQKHFEDELAKQKAAATALGTEAKADQASADATAKMWTGIGSGVGAAAPGVVKGIQSSTPAPKTEEDYMKAFNEAHV